MSIVVNSRPAKTIETRFCRWFVSGRPAVYSLTRKDQAFNSGANSAGFLRIRITGVDLTALFNVNDLIYIKSDDGIYSAQGTVTAEVFSVGDTLITTDITYTSACGAGYLNFITTRANYRLNVQVYRDTSTLIGPVLKYAPDAAGNINVIITQYLEAQLSPLLDFTFADPVQTNGSITGKFFIKYTEVWTGSAEAETSDSANYLNPVLGNMNLKEPHIPHLYDYAETWANGNLIKWLKRGGDIRFDPLVGDQLFINTSRDYKTYLSFITYLGIDPFKIVIKKYKGTMLDSTTVLGPYTIQGELCDLEIEEETDEEVTSMTVQITDDFAGTPVPFSELITFEYVCYTNVVKLLWRNSLGGLEEFYFEYSEELEYAYPSGRKAKRLNLPAFNVTQKTWEAVNELNSTKAVFGENTIEVTPDTFRSAVKINQQVYLFEADGTVFGVICIPSTMRRLTRDKYNSIEIQVEYPEGI